MPFKARVWTAGKLLLLATALLATYALFAMATMRVAFRAREVQLPDLTGRDLAEATRLLGDAGLTVRLDDSKRFDPKVAAGRIAAQDPAAGLAVRRGRSVKVWISQGARVPVAPRLVGETERTAQRRLAEEGLSQASVADIRSDQYQPDIVVAQDPAPGSPGDKVALLVNRGERASGYVMPDLIGVPGDAAVEILRSHGLRATVVAQLPYPGLPGGIVLRQYPTAGFQVTADQPISLEVSR
jgi:beta-lactam-binding protein with PASTA domain